MRFAVLWEKHTLAVEAVTREAQELWVTNLNAIMQLQVCLACRCSLDIFVIFSAARYSAIIGLSF
jgi:hypothetical protein